MKTSNKALIARMPGFCRENAPLSLLMLATSFVVAFAMCLSGPWVLPVGTMIAFVTIGAMMRTCEQYDGRASRPPTENDPKWLVIVNNVKVGELTDATLATIQKSVLLDLRVHLDQMSNWVNGVFLAVCNLVRIIPATAFWALLAVLAFDADSVRQALAVLHAASPTELQEYALRVLQLVSLCAVMALALGVVMGIARASSLGFDNRYKSETLSRVLQHVNCAATGTICLMQQSRQLSRNSMSAVNWD